MNKAAFISSLEAAILKTAEMHCGPVLCRIGSFGVLWCRLR